MYSIGEFSKISNLSIQTLRFYHEKGLLIPAVIDPDSGYRYFNDANVERARVIAALRRLEFSLDEIDNILDGCDDQADLIDHLNRRKQAVVGVIRRQRDIVSMLNGIIQTEKDARLLMENPSFHVEEKTLESVLVAGVRIKGKYSDCGQGFAKLGKLVGRHICGKPMCLYYDDEYREDDADMEPCFPVRKKLQIDGISFREIPSVRCVALLHRGPYEQLGTSYAKVLQYSKQKGYETILPSREVYLKGPGMIFKGNPKKYVTEIQVPVKW